MKGFFLGVVILVVFAADQVVKLWIRQHLVVGDPYHVIPGWFDLNLVYNPGAAFGIFTTFHDSVRRFALVAVSAAAIVVILHLLLAEARHDFIAQFGIALILGGAFGNILDRWRFDAVVDFLDVFYGEYHWPAFNIADSAISIGACFLILRMVFRRTAGAEAKKPDIAPAKTPAA